MSIAWLPQEVWLVRQTLMPIDLINHVARVCYQSITPSDEEKQCDFIKGLIKAGHESPLEFVDFIWFIFTNRAIANELVRHRIASYMQESTRYVQYDDIAVIEPNGKYDKAEMEAAYAKALIHYQTLIEKGVSKQFARDALPLGLATHMYAKMNLREFRHFLRLRTAQGAHPMMQDLAKKMLLSIHDTTNPNYFEAMFYDIKIPS